MSEPDDIALLKQYAEGDESAFATLFERHVNLVYSTAMRQTRNPSHAEEITQAVFILLARKAKSLSPRTVLSGWLYQAARLTTASLIKREVRRKRREQEVYMQTLTEPETSLWEQISPLLEEAMGRLGEQDRNAIVLRFFENRTPQEVAATLKLNEVAARKRVSRALEKLRKFFATRGVVLTSAIIAGAISENSVQAAPVAVANAAAALAIAKGAATSTSTLTLAKGALKIMAWTKAQTAIVAGVGVLLAVTATTMAVKRNEARNAWDIWPNGSPAFFAALKQAPAQVRILPTKYPGHRGSYSGDAGGKMMGFNEPVGGIVQHAYSHSSGREWDDAQTIISQNVPQGHYDFIANLPDGSELALQKEIERKLGVVGKRETQNVDVLLLTVENPNAPGLKPGRPNRGRSSDTLPDGEGEASFIGYKMSDLAVDLEQVLRVPVVDGTGLPGNFDFTMKWNDQDPSVMKQSLTDQLGLTLVRTNMPIEMLVVERAGS